MAVEFFTAFIIAYGLLFLAELGDKTQLIILTLATKKYNPKLLALGATLGFAVIVFLGGILANIITRFIELKWISFGSGLLFILLGLIAIIGLIRKGNKSNEKDEIAESEEDAKKFANKSKNSLLVGFLAIFTMEMGDKTQVMTILLAATSTSFYGTLLGSWAALSTLAILGAFIGEWIAKKVPKKIMDWIAAILFLIIGILISISILL